uniref:S-protein homolog n=1 Tax=Noccaea caerulescens TaxID=107243 RepID=A0A1J3IJ55_NOCCA
MKNISIFLFVFALCLIDKAYGGQKTTLLFRNGFDHGRWLKVHCKSGDDDMGEKYLPPKSPNDYIFSFNDNAWGTTRFWCTLSKGPDYKIRKTFDAYKQQSSEPHETSYHYLARDDGIYHNTLQNFKLRKVYDWN